MKVFYNFQAFCWFDFVNKYSTELVSVCGLSRQFSTQVNSHAARCGELAHWHTFQQITGFVIHSSFLFLSVFIFVNANVSEKWWKNYVVMFSTMLILHTCTLINLLIYTLCPKLRARTYFTCYTSENNVRGKNTLFWSLVM